MAESEGRSCPLAYRYSPAELCAQPEESAADVLYVVGGLYGNLAALDEIERMAGEEERAGRRVQLIFNGDFNWFNARDDLFCEMNERVLEHTVSLGNVEYELANPSPGAGCGCAYPDFVDQAVVTRSNRIMERLQATARDHPELQRRLSRLPRYRCLIFGGLKILVVHGDPQSLAGWGLAHEAFVAGNGDRLSEWFLACGADVIASTHTCLPALWSGLAAGQSRVVANNGSAGMANLRSDRRGLLTRIALCGSGSKGIAGMTHRGVDVALLPVPYSLEAWLPEFDRLWPAGSPAAVSYRSRILNGTTLNADDIVFPSKT